MARLHSVLSSGRDIQLSMSSSERKKGSRNNREEGAREEWTVKI